MMVHPASFDFVQPKTAAASMFKVEYQGKEALPCLRHRRRFLLAMPAVFALPTQ
jgi:hypothetical protein